MNIADLLADMIKKYPKQADVIEAWAPQYRQRLERYEGPRLAEAYMILMTDWRVLWFPRPHEIAQYLPQPKHVAEAGESDAARTTREDKERCEAACKWWDEHGTAVSLFYEFRHRCRKGLPTPEDIAGFERQNKRDKEAEELRLSATLTPVGQVTPNYVPQARRLTREEIYSEDGPGDPPPDEIPPPTSEEDYGEESEVTYPT